MEFKNLKLPKNLKGSYLSFFSLFMFSILLYFISSNKIYSQTIEEIKKEVTNIESIPSREKAEMNIEVTKMTSEKMKGKINLEEKTIILDLKEINERLGRKRGTASTGLYEIFFTDDLNNFSNFLTEKTGRISRGLIGKYIYEIDVQEGEERIKVNYSEKPETLYMIVMDKNTQVLVKVFSISEFTTLTGKIGGANDFLFTSILKGLSVRDYVGETFVSVNNVGTLQAKQYNYDTNFRRNAFPTIALGSNWKKETNNIDKTEVTSLKSNFSISSTNTNKIEIEIYLKSPIKAGAATGIYKHYISGLGTTSEKSRVYGAYVNSSDANTEQIDATLIMEYPTTILTSIRKINQASFTISSYDTDQINYAVSTYNGNQFKIPYENSETYNNVSNITKQNYPTIAVTKEIVMNNVVLEFRQGYTKGNYITFTSNGTTTEPNIIKTVTAVTGDNSKYFNSNHFMTGTPFNGTINITGSSINKTGTNSIAVDASGITAEQTLTLTNGGKTANLKLKYETNGTVKMSLVNWSGQGEFPLIIVHKEESGLVRRIYNVTIKSPSTFEFVSATNLDFGTIIKGFTGDTATNPATIIVKGLNSNGLKFAPSQTTLVLTNGTSIIEAGNFTISNPIIANGVETYTLTGAILKSSDATTSGDHTGTLQLNVEIVPQPTGVNRR